MQKIISGYFILSLSKTYIVEGHISDGECETWCGRRYWPRAAIREVIFSTFFKTDFPKRLSKTYIAEGLIYQARISVMVYVNLAIMKSRWLRTSPLCTGIKIWGNFLETLKNRLYKGTRYTKEEVQIAILTSFTMRKLSTRYKDPIKQAEYAYSLIEAVENIESEAK